VAADLHVPKPDGKFAAFSRPPGPIVSAVIAPTVAASDRNAEASGQVLFDDGALRITWTTDGLVLAGDIDEASYAAVVVALIEVAGRPGEIHVDLAAVQYCDLAGLRAFVLASADRHESPDHHGRCVILHHLHAHLRAALRVVGWDAAPGLVIEDPPQF
jgi:ABC-type transporter Mla MlaB component